MDYRPLPGFLKDRAYGPIDPYRTRVRWRLHPCMKKPGFWRLGRGSNKTREQGASLVEFAVAMPLLLLLVLGIIEFGFVLAQMNEMRHGAREGARYAAVSRPDYDGSGAVNEDDVLEVTCDAVNLPGATVRVSASFDGGSDRLDYGTLTVDTDTDSLSGAPLISVLLPDTMTNEATFRLEQSAEWSAFGPTECP